MLRGRKARKARAMSGPPSAVRLVLRWLGAAGCEPARRGGLTSVSRAWAAARLALHAKRPTEAGQRTAAALAESRSVEGLRPSENRLEIIWLSPIFRDASCWGDEPRDRRRSHEHRSSDKSTTAPRAATIRTTTARTTATRAPTTRKLTTRTASQATSRATAVPPRTLKRLTRNRMLRARTLEARAPKNQPLKSQPCGKLLEMQSRAPSRSTAEPPRKLLRVKGLGDKLGYPQGSFVPPSIFSDKP